MWHTLTAPNNKIIGIGMSVMAEPDVRSFWKRPDAAAQPPARNSPQRPYTLLNGAHGMLSYDAP